MRATETGPTVMPLRVPIAAQSASKQKGTDLRWRLEMAPANAAVSGSQPLSANAASVTVSKDTGFRPDQKQTASESEVAAGSCAETPTATTNEAATNRQLGTDCRLSVTVAAKATREPGGQVAVSKTKRDAQSVSFSDTSPNAHPCSDAASTPVDARSTATQQSVDPVDRCDVATNKAPAGSHPPTVAAVTTPVCAVTKTGDASTDVVSQPASPATLGHEVGVGRQKPTSTSSPEPSTDRSTGSASTVPAITEARVASSVVSHVTTGAIPNVALQTALPNHPSLPVEQKSTHLESASPTGAMGSGGPQITASGPARLDIGVFDGTHGWLRIRAELDTAGTVSASLTASQSAHASLRSALPEMTTYLGSEAVNVSKIAVHRFSDGSSFTSASEGKGNGTAFGRHDQGGPHSGAQKKQSSGTGYSEHSGWLAPSESTWTFGAMGRSSGNWLNVCA